MFIQRSKYYTKKPQPIDKTFPFLRLDNTSPITDVRNHWNGSFLTDSFVNICKSAETGAVWITNYGRLKRTQVKGQCKRIRKHAIRIRTRRGKGLYIHLYPSSIWNSGFILKFGLALSFVGCRCWATKASRKRRGHSGKW